MKTSATLAALALSCGAAVAGGPMPFGDDLTDGLFDPAFNYDFSSDFPGNGPGGDFNSLDPGPGAGLLLASDEVVITWPGIPDAIGLAQVDFTDYTGPGATEVEFFGTLGSMLFSNATVSALESFQVDMSSGIGAITSIRISAFETYVHSISLRSIPTPGALALLGVAGMAGLRRRR